MSNVAMSLIRPVIAIKRDVLIYWSPRGWIHLNLVAFGGRTIRSGGKINWLTHGITVLRVGKIRHCLNLLLSLWVLLHANPHAFMQFCGDLCLMIETWDINEGRMEVLEVKLHLRFGRCQSWLTFTWFKGGALRRRWWSFLSPGNFTRFKGAI